MKKSSISLRAAQAGLGHVVVLALVVLVFAVIGFIGYKLYAKPKATTHQPAITTTNPAAGDLTAPEITSASDLDTAASTLDQVNPSGDAQSDESALDTQLNAF